MPGLTKSCHTIAGVSDHDHGVMLEVEISVVHNKKTQRRVPVYKRANWDQIRADMLKFEEQYMDSVPSSFSVEENWLRFKDCLISSVKANIPSKLISNRENLPWCNREAKRLIAMKHRAYNTAKRLQNHRSWAKFRKLRKKVQLTLHTSYLEYLNNLFAEDDKSSKSFWKFVKSKKTEFLGVGTLNTTTGQAITPKDKARALNEQFTSVFTEED